MSSIKNALGVKQLLIFSALLLLSGCTQESQNKLGRAIQNYTGTNGVLDVYAGEKLVKRFIKVDKLTTGSESGDTQTRAYRYGYGVMDENFNLKVDEGEKRVYFEVSDYSTSYVFYENTLK
jgi:type IV pilus biogenesis protein CpaD/CtpE